MTVLSAAESTNIASFQVGILREIGMSKTCRSRDLVMVCCTSWFDHHADFTWFVQCPSEDPWTYWLHCSPLAHDGKVSEDTWICVMSCQTHCVAPWLAWRTDIYSLPGAMVTVSCVTVSCVTASLYCMVIVCLSGIARPFATSLADQGLIEMRGVSWSSWGRCSSLFCLWGTTCVICNLFCNRCFLCRNVLQIIFSSMWWCFSEPEASLCCCWFECNVQ